MLMRATVTPRDDNPIALFVDSSRPFPLFLQDGAWKKAGIDVSSLAAVPDVPNVKQGTVPVFRVGGFDLAKMPAIAGADLGELANVLDIDLGGVVGADLLAFFRVTFEDEGRFIWIEPDPSLLQAAPPGAPGATPNATPTPTPTSGSTSIRPPAPGKP
jgi:hypothetical protein